jgi:hypothetical protein
VRTPGNSAEAGAHPIIHTFDQLTDTSGPASSP